MAEAIALNAWEEGRHKEVLSCLVAAYGIALAPEPEYRPPRDAEWAYLVTGFGECVDSFFAFGLFAMAKRSGFFPPALVDTFEPVMQEECRHILLFANWLAWHRARLKPWHRPFFEARVAAVWVVLASKRIGIARGMDGKRKPLDSNFTLASGKAASGEDIGPAALMELCLVENDRRFAGYDKQLRRPTTVPFLAPDANPIGFLGFDEPETGLWRPFGSRRVIHFSHADLPAELRSRGFKYALVSEYTLVNNSKLSPADG